MDAADLQHLASILPRGRDNATCVSDLAEVLTMRACCQTVYTDRAVREGLEQLVNEHRVPVCTLPTAKGVYVAVTPEELDAADAHLRAKAYALLRRRRSLRLCREHLAFRPTLFEI